ncbi:unnamed protein product [Arctia plantaginis]|uniref:Galactose mutarotase n=1 Tax=Arctia plantaginis TaxID=874455 RepID=A0A8S1B3T8_ARCPL|nr:unnamed protein product [Arctia plantaginis]
MYGKGKFSQSYANLQEYSTRFQHFVSSYREIQKLNAASRDSGSSGAKYGLTKLSDMSQSEFKEIHLSDEKVSKAPKSYNKNWNHGREMSDTLRYDMDPGNSTHHKDRSGGNKANVNLYINIRTKRVALPMTVDWRTKGIIGPVRNQGLCGACWAFSTVGVIEAMSAIETGKLETLSVQEVIDCAKLGNKGCAGGDICLLLDWLLTSSTGVGIDKEYPLSLTNGVCKANKTTAGVKVASFTCDDFVGSENKILEALAIHGPVAVAVNALTWQHYLGGVIQFHCSGSPADLNHAVELVGYDLTAEVPYYIAKNSWGKDFGNGGYIYLAIGSNICGLANEVATVVVIPTSCSVDVPTPYQLITEMVKLIVEDFGVHQEKKVKKFTWTLANGFSLSAISYGAIVQAIKVPDRYGIRKDVVLGFDDLDSYVSRNTPYLGAAVGRCANRIGHASFEIDGNTYGLAKNVAKEHHLHGGLVGFDKMVWESTVDQSKVIFSYLSKDGEEGYPGDLLTNITYEVTDDGCFHVEFIATTTKKTVVNLTNHSYFNLAGHDAGSEELYNHLVYINADRITETNSDSIPTGNFINVQGTPFDFTKEKRLGDSMSGNLFDDNFCVNLGKEDLTLVSRVTHSLSGRVLEVYSDQPGVQFYTANFLPLPSEEALVGKDSVGYRRHGAFCLETQKYPDAVHHKNFPSAILVPGQIYRHRVMYKFSDKGTVEPVVASA